MNVFFASSVVTAVIVLSVCVSARTPSDRVSFLDVGQGDAILLQEGDVQILIDGGPGNAVIEQLEHEMPTFDRTIEVLVVSHPQQDHFEGFLHILNQYNVKTVLLPHAAAKSELYKAFLQQLEMKKIPYRFAWAGQHISFHNLTLSILGPIDIPIARTIARADINNASTIVRVDFHNMSFLLTGDAERIAEHILVQNTTPELLDVNILKVGHHGSSSSTFTELLTATSPLGVPISVGQGNRFGHPARQTLDRLEGIPLWRTDIQGTIRFLWDGQEWSSITPLGAK